MDSIDFIFSTEGQHEQWALICLEKFARSFTDSAVLANALTARQAIFILEDGLPCRTGITSHNVVLALEAIDKSEASIFTIADTGRHGTILKSFVGASLFEKLELKDSEILMYESACFYSESEDFYVVNLYQYDASQKYVLYLKINYEYNTIYYTVDDDIQTHKGSIIASKVLDPDQDNRELAVELSAQLPEILQMISSVNPDHIDQRVANSFAQHYKCILDRDYLDGGQQQDSIIQEKRLFTNDINRLISSCIAEKLYHRAKTRLQELVDNPMIPDDMKYDARQFLANGRQSTLNSEFAEIEILSELCLKIKQAMESVREFLADIDQSTQQKSNKSLTSSTGLSLFGKQKTASSQYAMSSLMHGL